MAWFERLKWWWRRLLDQPCGWYSDARFEEELRGHATEYRHSKHFCKCKGQG